MHGSSKAFIDAFNKNYTKSEVVYASKAFINVPLARLLSAYGLGFDVVSGGELAVLKVAEVDTSVEEAASATVKAMEISSAVDATVEAMAPKPTETPTPQPIGKAPSPKVAEVDTSVEEAASATAKAMEISAAVDLSIIPI